MFPPLEFGGPFGSTLILGQALAHFIMQGELTFESLMSQIQMADLERVKVSNVVQQHCVQNFKKTDLQLVFINNILQISVLWVLFSCGSSGSTN